MPDAKRLFEAVRAIAGRALTQAEVDSINAALTDAPTPAPATTAAPPVAARPTGLKDPAKFFTLAKDVLGELTQSEVDGTNAILSACGEAGYGLGDTAYALATAYHETAGTMQPVKEYGGPAYFKKMYDIEGSRPTLAKKMGNIHPGDGAKYPGRGYVQLTWLSNYLHADAELRKRGITKVGESIVVNPDLAMRPDIAAAIMVFGMTEGWFTSRELDDDIPRSGPATYEQFFRSRDIINGTDKQDKIAREAVEFQEGLIAGGWG